MHLHHLSKTSDSNDSCQICGAALRIVEIEPHPKRGEWEIHGFSCGNCGPVKSLVVRRLFKPSRPKRIRDLGF